MSTQVDGQMDQDERLWVGLTREQGGGKSEHLGTWNVRWAGR